VNDYLLLLPPIAFLIIFVFVWLQYVGLKVFSAGEKWPEEKGKTESYACGHEMKDSRVNPNYSQFFPFAFFFTIMHVVALVVATFPKGNIEAIGLGVGYLVSASVSLFILFKR
jgi:NADH-quinone oxidoreductase subunit A